MPVRRTVTMAAVTASLIAAIIGWRTPVMASEGNGILENGEFIGWDDCQFQGMSYDFARDHKDYRDLTFVDRSHQTGQAVTDNISSVANLSAVNSVNAYVEAGYTGPRLVILPLQSFDLCVDLPEFNNALRSHHF